MILLGNISGVSGGGAPPAKIRALDDPWRLARLEINVGNIYHVKIVSRIHRALRERL